MAYRSNVRYITFQQRLLEKELNKIESYIRNSKLGVTKEHYYQICELQNQPVEEDKIPVEYSDFLIDTQIAIQIVSLLPDRWDTMNGNYLGKDLTLVPFLLDQYRVTNTLDTMFLMTCVIDTTTEVTNDKIRSKQK